MSNDGALAKQTHEANKFKTLRICGIFAAVVSGAAIIGVGYEAINNPTQSLLKVARLNVATAVNPLVRMGANIQPNDPYDSPLWIAALRGNTSTVKALINAGADIHAADDLALRVAAEHGHLKTVELLLDHGANLHARRDDALMWSSMNGHTAVVNVLLDRGADIHADTEVSLWWAARNGHNETLELLLKRGANPRSRGDEIINIARENGHSKTVEILNSYSPTGNGHNFIPIGP